MIQSKGRLKTNKLVQMVKSVPSALTQAVSFPTNEEQREKITYHVVGLGQL